MKRLIEHRLKSESELKELLPVIRDYVKACTEATKNEVALEGRSITIRPAKGNTSLHCLDEVSEICKVFRLSNYVAIEDNLPVINIF